VPADAYLGEGKGYEPVPLMYGALPRPGGRRTTRMIPYRFRLYFATGCWLVYDAAGHPSRSPGGYAGSIPATTLCVCPTTLSTPDCTRYRCGI
jgi:hypothetical protein